MSCIHFKFSNAVENDKIKFDGLDISVADLKEAIVKQKSLKSNLYSLRIIDSQTKKEYSDGKEMLPRNTSVIVSRVPLPSAQRIPKSKLKDPTLPQSSVKDTGNKMLTAEELRKTADLANANATEEEKVKAMILQSGEGYDPSQYVWTARGGSSGPGIMPGLKKNPPPPSYVCYRCGNRGHWIQLCPTNGDPTFNNRFPKRAMGIPSSEIVTVGEDVPGAMLDRFGRLVVRAVDYKAVDDYRNKKRNKQPPEEPPKALEPSPELICSLCKKLMKDAVIIPCCGESYCYDCIQDYLCENEFTCPSCKKEGVSPDNLAPNKALRKSAKNFLLKAAEDKSVAMASTTGFVKKVPPKLSTPQQLAASNVTRHAVTGHTATRHVPTGHTATRHVPTGQVTEDKVQVPASSDGEVILTGVKVEDKVEEIVATAPEINVDPTPAKQDTTGEKAEKTAKSAEMEASAGSVTQDSLGVKVKETKSKSRSASPASSSVASPIVMPSALSGTAAGVGVGPGGERPAINTKLLAKMAAMKQATLPGMLSGVPLTNSGLLSKTLGATGSSGMLRSRQGLYSQMLGVPTAVLPGQAGLVPTQSKIRTSAGTSSDPTKLDRLAAELLLNSAVSKNRAASPSPPPPPPLSQDEFYRHQKLLKLFAKKRSSGSSSYSSGSRSSSSSYSRSRSRSPVHSSRRRKHKRDKRHDKSKDKRSRARDYEEPRSRAREDVKKDRSKHRHSKRKRHESPGLSPDREVKQKRSRKHRSRSRSPNKKLALEELADAVNLSSPEYSLTGSNAPSEGRTAANELPETLSEVEAQHTRKHKKKSKKKRKHHRRSSEEETEVGDMERQVSSPEARSVADVGVEPDAVAGEGGAPDSNVGEDKDVVKQSPEQVGGAPEGEEEDRTESPGEGKMAEAQVCGREEGEEPLGDRNAAEQEEPKQEERAESDGMTAEVVKDAKEDVEMEESVEISLHADDLGTLDPALEDTTNTADTADTTENGQKESNTKPEQDTPPLSEDDVASILDLLEPLDEWESLGLELRVPGRKLTHYRQKSPIEALEKVVLYWLVTAPKENRTWNYLVKSLRRVGEKSKANTISKKYLPGTAPGKEEGEISDSDDDSRKSTDLRELLIGHAPEEPDLRETINSRKTVVNRKRHIPTESRDDKSGGDSEQDDEVFDNKSHRHSKKSAKRFKKSSVVQGIASSMLALPESYSSSDVSDSEDDSTSSSSESEQEYVKPSRSKRKAAKLKKHRSQGKYESREREKDRERRKEKKSKKDKKHKSSRERKRSSKSHKVKKSSRTEHDSRREKKLKKHKKSSHSHH